MCQGRHLLEGSTITIPFKDEETEAQNFGGTCDSAEPDLKPKSLDRSVKSIGLMTELLLFF